MRNKGFTLIELIIAISIFSTILLLGYKVIDGTSISTKKQSEIFNEQQVTNLLNKYFTKDIEKAISIEFINIDKSGNVIIRNSADDEYSYGYLLKTIENGNEKDSKYDGNVNKKEKTYSINRIVGSENLVLVSNHKYTDTDVEPLCIKKYDNNLYNIKLLSGKHDYEFNVSSRISEEENTDEKEDVNVYYGNGIDIDYRDGVGIKLNGQDDYIFKFTYGSNNERYTLDKFEIIFDGAYAKVYINGVEKFRVHKIGYPSNVVIKLEHYYLYDRVYINSSVYKDKEYIESPEMVQRIAVENLTINHGAKSGLSIIW